MPFENVLVVDDEPGLRNLIQRLLELENFNVYTAGNVNEGLEVLNKNEIDIVITDVRLPDKTGLELLKIVKKSFPNIEIIILTAYGKIEDGVKAIKDGAYDYLVKGDEDSKLIQVIKNAQSKIRLSKRISNLEAAINTHYNFNSITTVSAKMIEVIEIAKKAAVSDTPILLIGGTGTGKEVFARSIHYTSNRKNENFVAVNCSGFSKDLLESEMFGYKAGAFTGATKNKKGLFEEANGGTLFLDEIGEMEINLQAKLLRVLENNSFIKAGDTKETTVDVRIIAATNRDLKRMISEGKFRDDLYYRISVIQIDLPPLRERKEDIKLLTENFFAIFSNKLNKSKPNLDDSFYKRLLEYDFPGNTRELKNIIERLILLVDKETLTEADLPNDILQKIYKSNGINKDKLEEVERQHILKILKEKKNNKAETAEILGIGLTTLYRKLKEYGIDEN